MRLLQVQPGTVLGPGLREVIVSAPVYVGGGGGLPRLRWPSGLCEVVETAGLSLVGGVGPSSSRSRFSATASRWWRRRQGIRSSRALPCLGGALLRCRRRARGGKVRSVWILYRRLSPAVLRRLSEAVDPTALSFKDVVAAVGSTVGRQADRAPPPFDGGRRQASVRE
jgi:hypothetical protein